MGWTRLLSGHIRDPLVGRDVLNGCLGGVILSLTMVVHDLIPRWLGWPPPAPLLSVPYVLLGPRYTLGYVLRVVRPALQESLQGVFGVILIKLFVKRTWVVLVVAAIVFFSIAITGTLSGEQLSIDIAMT